MTLFTVTTAVDENDGGIGGTGLSLREAISLANTTAGADSIDFAGQLTGQTITLTQGELVISSELTLNGLGASNLTISGNNLSRVFKVDNFSTSLVNVSIDGVTITGGLSSNGGGLYNQENLTISNTFFTYNSATSNGGGLYNQGTLSASNTTFDDNSATDGGGIYNNETATISNSNLISNTAGQDGGGIYNNFNATINNSNFSSNTAEQDGGSIYNNFNATINNSNFSSNTARRDGGGLSNKETLTLSNSTLNHNTASNNGGAISNKEGGSAILSQITVSDNMAVNGGGIATTTLSDTNLSNSTVTFNWATSGAGLFNQDSTTTVTSTIVAQNDGIQDLGGSAFTSGGNNLIGNGQGASGFTNGVNNDIVGTAANPINARLGPLQNNGGTTLTQALLTGSPALNTGSNPNNLATDQRGQGFNRMVGGATDIGAFETQTDNNPSVKLIDIEKTTNGLSNSNPIAPDYDNEDAANGLGVPILTPGTSVTWTYKVTNTGTWSFTKSDVALVDDNGTPSNTADDLTVANGKIAFQSVLSGDADDSLEPGEIWQYGATGIVQNLTTLGTASTFNFSGSSALDGADGNIRTFNSGSLSVKASGFSRDKSNGNWSAAYLGSYGGGLGVTDSSEGDGGGNTHTVDNIGRDNYVLFEFNQSVVVDSAFLGYVVNDSDLTVWIGTATDPFNNHLTLSNAVLSGLGFTEVNLTDLSTSRLADLNAGNVSGNVLVVAGWTGDDTPEDQFKIDKVTVRQSQSGIYENKATVTAPGAPSDSDLSHYKNPAGITPPPPAIRIEKATNGQWGEQSIPLPVGTAVTWSYQVFNEGTTPLNITNIVDDCGTPSNASDDFRPVAVLNGNFNAGDLNQNNRLDSNETWQYTSAGAVSYQVPSQGGGVLNVDLGKAADFGLLVLNGGKVANFKPKDSAIVGNIGYGKNVEAKNNEFKGSTTLTGTVSVDTTATYEAKNFLPSGGVVRNTTTNTLLNQANTDALNASTQLVSLAPTQQFVNKIESNLTINSTGAVNVIKIDELELKSGEILTLDGRNGFNDYFVINVVDLNNSGKTQFKLDGGQIKLVDVNPNRVIFNFPIEAGSDIPNNGDIEIKNSSIAFGTFLAPAEKVKVDAGNLSGAAIVKEFEVNDKPFNLTQASFTSQASGASNSAFTGTVAVTAQDSLGNLISDKDSSSHYGINGQLIQGAASNDVLVGTGNNDVIVGGAGQDVLTGNGGNDTFVYQAASDVGDRITDFASGDQIKILPLLNNVGYNGNNPLTAGYFSFSRSGNNTIITLDTDGTAGAATPINLVTLENFSGALLYDSVLGAILPQALPSI